MKNMLTKKGYEVGITHTGQEAIAVVQEKSVDIIFIDVKLPTINNLKTYSATRKSNPEATAFMMTAYRK